MTNTETARALIFSARKLLRSDEIGYLRDESVQLDQVMLEVGRLLSGAMTLVDEIEEIASVR